MTAWLVWFREPLGIWALETRQHVIGLVYSHDSEYPQPYPCQRLLIETYDVQLTRNLIDRTKLTMLMDETRLKQKKQN